MREGLETFFLLLGPKGKSAWRRGRFSEERHPVLVLLFTLLGFGFAVGIYLGSAWFLRHCLQVELVGPLITRKLLTLVLMILLSILVISTLINSFSIIFLSEDLSTLMSAPVPTGPLYFARFGEMVLHSVWMVLFFGLPIFLAYGHVYHAPLGFYVSLILLFPGLILIPAAIGAILATLLTCLFSARRSRDLLVFLSIATFVVLYLLVRAMRPEQWLDQSTFGNMMEFLDMFRSAEWPFLPTSWMTQVMFCFLEGRRGFWLPSLGIVSTALALVSISGWICTALYRVGYSRAQEGRTRWSKAVGSSSSPGRILGRFLDRGGNALGPLTGSLLVKDLRVFFRDTNQWLQLLLLGALAAVYLLNFVYLKLAKFSWFTLYTVNHVLLGLILAGIAVRLIFPVVSLEGRAFWIIRVAPVRISAFLHSKLIIYFIPLAILGITLSLISSRIIGVPPIFAVVSVGLVLLMTLDISALAVGIGAIHPRFALENPAKIPTGIGGMTYMITSMGFVIALLLSSFYPTFVLYQLPDRLAHPIARPQSFVTSLALSAVLGIAGAWLPMFLGQRSLSRRQRHD